MFSFPPHRGRNQKTKKVSYTVVDHEDQVGKLADGKSKRGGREIERSMCV